MARRPCARSERGFSLVELLVATGIMVAATAAVFSLLNPSQGTFQTQPEVADMQQRLRIGADSLTKDIIMAGAGTYSGANVASLGNFFAPIVPYRTGARTPDAPGTFKTDTISVMYVPPTASQTTIRDQMPNTSSEIKVNAQPGCSPSDQLCGFEEGMRVVIFDDTGSYDPFTITQVQTAALHLQHRADDFSKAYGPGAAIAEIAAHTYYLRTDTATNTYQLMHYDGYQTDLPVADNVVGLAFEYYGEAAPPALIRPVTDATGPWTTYGPKPPALGVDMKNGDEYAAGENCTFRRDAVSGLQVPRLSSLGPGPALVPLGQAELSDGPWCPNATAANRFDADLFRVRQVRVRLRVQVAPAWLRGPAGTLFARGGTSSGGERYVPDQELRFDITPRNLNLGR